MNFFRLYRKIEKCFPIFFENNEKKTIYFNCDGKLIQFEKKFLSYQKILNSVEKTRLFRS